MGCFKDSEARDLPTAVDVRPLTVEGCVSKCGQSGFSMAGLQSSTLCFCGTTYSRYGRLRDEHCTMHCNGNYKEICGGFMMNSMYYTGKTGDSINNPTWEAFEGHASVVRKIREAVRMSTNVPYTPWSLR